jgi:cytoskeleton protein RodZ
MSDVPGEVTPNESGEPSQNPPNAVTAGGLLRQARVAKGLHIAALATSIKVAPRKLELLEADRFDELPGATFTRALAQTICRTLKIDAAPVLALLPQPIDQGLSQMSLGLNAPFRDKPGRRAPSDLQFLRSPVVLGAVALVVASALLFLLPAGWVAQITQITQMTQHTGTATEPETSTTVITPPIVVPSVPSVPASGAAAASGPAAPAVPPDMSASAPVAVSAPLAASASVPLALASAPAGALLLSANAQSWIEVLDGRGQTLLSRNLEAGETVGLDGPSPLRVRIGNASATRVSFKGRPVELTPSRDNVAKLELR